MQTAAKFPKTQRKRMKHILGGMLKAVARKLYSPRAERFMAYGLSVVTACIAIAAITVWIAGYGDTAALIGAGGGALIVLNCLLERLPFNLEDIADKLLARDEPVASGEVILYPGKEAVDTEVKPLAS